MLLPAELPYQHGQPIPAGYHLESHEDRALAVTGAAGFALFYFISIAIAIGDSHDQRAHDALLLPVIGPFVATAFVQHEDRPADVRVTYLVLGAFQTAGVGLMVLSELPLYRTERLVLDRPSVRWGVGGVGSGQGVKISGSF